MNKQFLSGRTFDWVVAGTILFVMAALLFGRGVKTAKAMEVAGPAEKVVSVSRNAPSQITWHGYAAPSSTSTPAADDPAALDPLLQTMVVPEPRQAQPQPSATPADTPIAVAANIPGEAGGTNTADNGDMTVLVDAFGNPVGIRMAHPMDDGRYVIEQYRADENTGLPLYQLQVPDSNGFPPDPSQTTTPSEPAESSDSGD